MKDLVESQRKSLKNQIWFTRKTRIRTAERLLSNQFHSNLILVWYSFLTFAISIYAIKKPNFIGQDGDVIMTIATGAVFSLSLFIPQLELKTRYESVKQNYISLHTLYVESAFCSNKDDITEVQEKYSELLNAVENQTRLDLLYFLQFDAAPDCTMKNDFFDTLSVYLYLIIRTSAITLAYTLPPWFIMYYV
ncbi:SLATT domain-containing protein [Vibrio alginolyticus]|uniref:SLATT domain-containing protein n=1 Tax=Vibrio harveyi group TaxID=717610 RepID=UPI001B83AE49|nr:MULTISPECIES: SLATT domain-containing protein [Vibrio harveyi group]ELA8174546.1 SLATT domain-containing protein [Vibrio alginolyticus]EMA2426551.1 SLATT domain-containing protein [Vibrio alginolyticus]MBS9828916.1 SLATT domain-containing protein [Vibrio alginolyticus]MCS0236792.1 SLATT domain-containing protein [Vibrio alginolyticus]HBC3490708.1 SLATT domain-containing protein [Vibrio alginolyticus]